MVFGVGDAGPDPVGDIFRADALVGGKVRKQATQQVRFDCSGSDAADTNRMVRPFGGDGFGECLQPGFGGSVNAEAGKWINRCQ